jgi:hypothetical protein
MRAHRSCSDFATPGTGFKMGIPPRRIDILTKISGVEFAAAWPRRVDAVFGTVECGVIGAAHLVANKRAAGRLQDLADIEALEALARGRR